MRNLAGDESCDAVIRAELTRARIPIVQGKRSSGEVPFTVTGAVGPVTLYRAWTYWVATGPVPIDVARALYADPVGKTDVRVCGHSGCPDPDQGPWATHYDAQGRELVWNPGDQERRTFLRLVEKGLFKREVYDRYVWVEDPRAVAARSIVDSYHIDSELGLRLFADAVQSLTAGVP